jgi:hypothetical protein
VEQRPVIEVDGSWVEIRSDWETGQNGRLVLPSVATWRQSLGVGRPVVEVVVDSRSGEPQVTRVCVTAQGSSVRLRDLEALRRIRLDDVRRQIVEHYGGLRANPRVFADGVEVGVPAPDLPDGAEALKRVTAATRRQEALIRDVAEVYEAAGGLGAGGDAVEAVRLFLEGRGLGASTRSAQSRITMARRRGLTSDQWDDSEDFWVARADGTLYNPFREED